MPGREGTELSNRISPSSLSSIVALQVSSNLTGQGSSMSRPQISILGHDIELCYEGTFTNNWRTANPSLPYYSTLGRGPGSYPIIRGADHLDG
jgi:hypothetical protein